MIIVEYDDVGKFLSVITYPTSEREIVEAPLYQGRLFLPRGYLLDWAKHYVKDGDIADRPTLPVTFDGKFLRGVPQDATIFIDGTSYTADGSASIELEFDRIATFRIEVSLWPYLNKEFIHENLA